MGGGRPFFCLLALEIWAGLGPWSARFGRGSSPVSAANVVGGLARARGPERSAAVALRAADRRPQSEGQKGRTTIRGRPGMSGTGLIWHGGAITPTGVLLVASVEISADQSRRAHLGSLLCLCKLMRRT